MYHFSKVANVDLSFCFLQIKAKKFQMGSKLTMRFFSGSLFIRFFHFLQEIRRPGFCKSLYCFFLFQVLNSGGKLDPK